MTDTELQQIEDNRTRIRYINEAAHALDKVIRAKEDIRNKIPTYGSDLFMKSIERIKRSIDKETKRIV